MKNYVNMGDTNSEWILQNTHFHAAWIALLCSRCARYPFCLERSEKTTRVAPLA